VSAGGARRGRRDNGIDAASFAAAGDVDPRVGEHLLDVLAAGGIAAYLQPSADRDPVLRATTFPARPTDRLFVDRDHLATAREHLQKLTGGAATTSPDAPPADPTAAPAATASTATTTPTASPAGGDQKDVDAAWAQIVAGFHTTVDPGATPWPDAEHIDTKQPSAPETPPAPGSRLTDATGITGLGGVQHNRRRTDRPADDGSLLDGLDTFGTGFDDNDDENERYIPPPPPPLPHISKYAIAGILGVVVGFVLFLFPALLPIDHTVVTLIGFAAIVAGAVTLVWRLRSGDEDDDFDDGAVV
jgi:hypothetical protein